jgi:hypothetical protein
VRATARRLRAGIFTSITHKHTHPHLHKSTHTSCALTARDMDILSDYVYEPLEQPDKTIRLLKILTISPHICCKLIVVSLDDRPEYTTLSYVWGDPNARESVEIDGWILKITSSLASALQDTYGQFKSYPVDASTEHWLWADGICINQADDHEKNHQVPLMREIYSKCTTMFSWLGGGNDGNIPEKNISYGDIVDAINLVFTGISTSPGYDLFMSGFDHNKILSNRALNEYNSKLEYQTGHKFTDLAWLQKRCNATPDFQPNCDSTFLNIFALFEQPYWKRLWILQELILAQDSILLCGRKTVSWVTICGVFTWIRLVRIQYDLSARPRFMSESEWQALLFCGRAIHPFRLIADFKSLQATRVVSVQQVHDQHYQLSHETMLKRYEQRLRGAQNLSYAFRYKATNPKDYIYGMTSVTGYQVMPDYSRKTTVAEVYRRFTESYVITAKEAYEKGSSRAGSDIFWFFCLAGMGFEWRNTPDLPTWVPDFAGASEAFSRRHKDPFVYFAPSLGHNDETLWDHDMPHTEGPILCCMAIFVDEVRRMGPTLSTVRSFEGKHDEPHNWLLQLFDCVVDSRSDDRGPIGYGLLCEMSKLFCNKSKASHQESIKVLEMMVADLEYICRTCRDLRGAEFTAQLCKELSTSQTQDLLRRSDWSHAQATTECSILARMADALLYRSVLTGVNKLCMAFMASGSIGLLPPLSQVGDRVGAIKGYSLPVILRKSRGGYAFVGSCQISGYMDRKAEDVFQDGRAKMEEIKIY